MNGCAWRVCCHFAKGGNFYEQNNCVSSILTLSLPNFRRHLSFDFVQNKLSNGKKFIREVEKMNVKQRRPDETAHYEPSHLDLCCLQKPIIIACGSERVKPLKYRAAHEENSKFHSTLPYDTMYV